MANKSKEEMQRLKRLAIADKKRRELLEEFAKQAGVSVGVLDAQLQQRQKEAANDRVKSQTAKGQCPICKNYSLQLDWDTLGKHWVCEKCGWDSVKHKGQPKV
jgi:ribosomal protein L37AE/L43A